MSDHQAVYPVATMCRLLRVSPSGFHAWRQRGPSARACRDATLLEPIRQYHQRSDGTYGAPRIWKDLREEAGLYVGQKRVARLMRAAGLVGVSRRRGVRTTRRGAVETPAADLVRRDFTATAPNQLWVPTTPRWPKASLPRWSANSSIAAASGPKQRPG